MLKLVNITKDYILKDSENVHALKGITLNFRRNEFVAILGASGCGKTTLLNITGGLDRYTDGDLIIEGKSTKDYNDRDWDTYRNHSIGFVFQSYNLISHQTVLSNVELALTISGISKAERKRRAMEALEKVGLKGSEKKKPNQMSGGQMQRVAIARSLVNNPEILLADEPTGALDSETSIQIMDILKEVAKDRLVIMVTHNPELAEKYATRIVTMKDGLITGDTKPYEGESESERETILKAKKEIIESKGKKAKTSMSMVTAGALSLSNLRSKIRRTVLVTIAGSIGIIGVSAVLAVSNGVSNYIGHLQDDMLSAYPLSIAETSVDMTSLLSGLESWDAKDIPEFDMKSRVGLDSMITYLMDKYQDFTQVKTNDINPYLMSYIDAAPQGYYDAINYDYNIDLTNNIFTKWKKDKSAPEQMISINGLTQMYISELQTVENFGEYAMFVDLFTNFMKQLPAGKDHISYIEKQYDLLGEGSRMPQNDNEIVVVVDPESQTCTDFMYAQMGFYNEEEFLNICKKAIQENGDGFTTTPTEEFEYPESFTFDEILGKELKFYNHDTIYSYDSVNEKSVNFVLNIPLYPEKPDELTELKFDLSYEPKCDVLIGTVNTTMGSISSVFTRTENTTITGDETGEWIWASKLGAIAFHLSLKLDAGVVSMRLMADEKTGTWGPYFPVSTYTAADTQTQAYMYDAVAHNEWEGETVKIVGILKKKPSVTFGCLDRGVYFTQAFGEKYMEQAKDSKIVSCTDEDKLGLKSYISKNNGNETEPFEAYVKYSYTSYIKGDGDNKIEGVEGYANCLNEDLGGSMSNLFSIFGSSAFDTDKAHLRSLAGLASKLYTNPITGLYQYSFPCVPQTIQMFPKDFASKDKLTDYLDKWNSDEVITVVDGQTTADLKPEDREELTYNDTVELIVSVINTLITAITIALVAFTSLSLVVSCFMIAVITYISVVERVKEIGVIRSLGGRKRDVSNLFIAETFMTGLFSGAFGIIITYVFQIIFNAALNAKFGIYGMANLTPITALIMIAISILLSVISGLVPSMKASRQDPVTALRSE